MSKKQTLQDQIAHEEKYVEFLRVRLNSENFKANSTSAEIEKTKKSYDKAKFKLKFLKQTR